MTLEILCLFDLIRIEGESRQINKSFNPFFSSELEANRPLPPIPVDRTVAPPSSSAINDLYVNEVDDSTPPPLQAVEVPCPPVRNSLLGAENPAFEYNQLSPEPTRCASTSDQNINSAGIAAPPIPPRKLS